MVTRPADFKIVVAGPVGAGKATAVRWIGEGRAVSIDVPTSGGAWGDKSSAADAFGLIVLADNSQPDPIAQVEQHLRALAGSIDPQRTVVGVGRLDAHPLPGIGVYCARLAAAGWRVPVIDVDVRRETDVRLLLSVLVSLAEADERASSP